MYNRHHIDSIKIEQYSSDPRFLFNSSSGICTKYRRYHSPTACTLHSYKQSENQNSSNFPSQLLPIRNPAILHDNVDFLLVSSVQLATAGSSPYAFRSRSPQHGEEKREKRCGVCRRQGQVRGATTNCKRRPWRRHQHDITTRESAGELCGFRNRTHSNYRRRNRYCN